MQQLIFKSFLIGILVHLLFDTSLNAQPCIIKLHKFESTKTAEGTINSKPGKELNTFQVPANEHVLRMYIQTNVTDFAKMKVKNKIQLLVTTINKGNEIEIHNWAWYALTKNQVLSTDCYFPSGELTIKVVDADNHEIVFAKRTITVSPNAVKVANDNSDFPYNRGQFKIWTCKSIDDNWKPIDVITKIKVGECVQLFFESSDKLKNLGSMRWGIYKLKADGTEEYVNQKDQGIGQLDFWRRLSYEECDEFRTAGKYRIYIATKDDADAYNGVNTKNYFAKTDLFVE